MSKLICASEFLNNSYQFVIPSYQRGYRWSETEVKHLLNDLATFFQNKSTGYYCMQPIVVVKECEKYIVVDGQQRLTTFYMIAKILGKEKLYHISYENREKSQEFLEKLSCDLGVSNLDFHYMKVVYEFLEKNKSKIENIDFERIKFIWQEIETNEIEYFLNLNAFKTPLEEVELIKAKMILKAENKQELAKKWTEMENVLANDRFYYFLTNDKRKNRLSVLFEIHYQDKAIYQEYEKNPVDISKIYEYFSQLKEYYKKHETYHKLGYLVCFEGFKAFSCTNKDLNSYFDSYLKDLEIEKLNYSDTLELKKVFLYCEIKHHLQKNSYFRFDKYKTTCYDIEHIYPQAGEKELDLDEVREQFEITDKNFPKLSSGPIEDIDNISNLCLLNSSINRSYKNLPFELKRLILTKCSDEKDYILEHCKLAFLKNEHWTNDIAKKYLENLKNSLSK